MAVCDILIGLPGADLNSVRIRNGCLFFFVFAASAYCLSSLSPLNSDLILEVIGDENSSTEGSLYGFFSV